MGERTGYAPGTFSWADLSTTDTEGAKAFYTGLFGWDTEDTADPRGRRLHDAGQGRQERRGPVGREGGPAAGVERVRDRGERG